MNGLEVSGMDAMDTEETGDNATIITSAGIYSEYPLKVVLTGENSVTGAIGGKTKWKKNMNKYYYKSYGIYTGGLEIEENGVGSLTVKSAEEVTGYCYGIYSTDDVTVSGGELNTIVGVARNGHGSTSTTWYPSAISLYVDGDFTMEDGEVLAESLKVDNNKTPSTHAKQNAGIYATGNILVENGTLVGKGAEEDFETPINYYHNAGIYAGGNITIKKGTVTGIAGTGTNNSFSDITSLSMSGGGIVSVGDIDIYGGTVTGTGAAITDAANVGIWSQNVLTIYNGIVKGTGKTASDDWSVGIGAYNGVVIEDGQIEAISEGESEDTVMKSEEARKAGLSRASIGLYSYWDMTISGDAKVTAEASTALMYSYGTHCYKHFHMSGNASLQTSAKKTFLEYKNGSSVTPAYRPMRSLGLFMYDRVYQQSDELLQSVGGSFTMTGGKLEAWCTNKADSTTNKYNGRNFALRIYEEKDRQKVFFSDENQTDATWYAWTTERGGTLKNSAETPYVYSETEANHLGSYLLIQKATTETETYEVTFDSKGGSEIEESPVEVESGKTVDKPTDPEREGYTFLGWFTSEDDGETLADTEYDFTTAVTSSFTLYAKWQKDDGGDKDDKDDNDDKDDEKDPDKDDKDDEKDPDKDDDKDNSRPSGSSYGKVTLTKTDAEDTDTTLSGVKFALYKKGGKEIGEYTTDKNGEITVTRLSPGEYYWVEVSPAVGYSLDESKHSFTIYKNRHTEMTVENERSEIPAVFTNDHYAYIVGYEDGLIRPEANITRAEVAAIFFRLLDSETRESYLSTENNFYDVNEGDWFNSSVSAMAAMKIISGYPDGGFHPSANITRAEFAAIASRFEQNGNTSEASFADIYEHWAQKEINVASNNGWVLGYEDGSFRPDQYITRAEAMAMVNRVLQRIPRDTDDLIAGMKMWKDNANTAKWYYLTVQEATNSHDYARRANGYEYWTSLRQAPDWNVYQ